MNYYVVHERRGELVSQGFNEDDVNLVIRYIRNKRLKKGAYFLFNGKQLPHNGLSERKEDQLEDGCGEETQIACKQSIYQYES